MKTTNFLKQITIGGQVAILTLMLLVCEQTDLTVQDPLVEETQAVDTLEDQSLMLPDISWKTRWMEMA